MPGAGETTPCAWLKADSRMCNQNNCGYEWAQRGLVRLEAKLD